SRRGAPRGGSARGRRRPRRARGAGPSPRRPRRPRRPPRRRARARPRRGAAASGTGRCSPSSDYPRGMTDFRLLGPFEVLEDDRPVDLPQGKPRALLARLLLDAGRVVSAETLVESLWGDPAPPSAPKVLQVYIPQLRKALGPERVETGPPG